MESAGICASKESTESNYLIPLVAIHFAVLVYGNYIAYATRKANSVFSEAKFIAISMVSNLQVLAVGLPVLVIVADSTTSNYLVRTMVIFLNDFTVMALIFFPKFCDQELGTSFLGQNGSLSMYQTGSGATAHSSNATTTE